MTLPALYDSSNSEIIKGIMTAVGSFAATGGHGVYVRSSGAGFEVVLPRVDIKPIEQWKKGLMKQAVVTMKDESKFVFDYGLLSPKKLIDAIHR